MRERCPARILFLAADPVESSTRRLADAISAAGLLCTLSSIDQLRVDLHDEVVTPLDDWLADYDFFVIRNLTGPAWAFARTARYALLCRRPAFRHKLLNGESYTRFPFLSKLVQTCLLRASGLRCPRSTYMSLTGTTPFSFPYIVKGNHGSRGTDVHLVRNAMERDELIARYSTQDLLFQEFLPGSHDYRALVVGSVLVGFHKRSAPSGGFKTNYSAGGLLSEAEEDVRQNGEAIALAAASALSCEFCGVDLRHDADGRLCVIEVNRSAGFEGAEAVLGIPAGKRLAEHVLKRASEHNH